LAVGAEDDALDVACLAEEAVDLGDGDPGGAVDRETVGAGADGWEGDRVDAVLRVRGEAEALAIAGGELAILAGVAAAPDRANGVDHPPRRQTEAGRDPCLASWAATQIAASGQ
jgi:hypothetical protein